MRGLASSVLLCDLASIEGDMPQLKQTPEDGVHSVHYAANDLVPELHWESRVDEGWACDSQL